MYFIERFLYPTIRWVIRENIPPMVERFQLLICVFLVSVVVKLNHPENKITGGNNHERIDW